MGGLGNPDLKKEAEDNGAAEEGTADLDFYNLDVCSECQIYNVLPSLVKFLIDSVALDSLQDPASQNSKNLESSKFE